VQRLVAAAALVTTIITAVQLDARRREGFAFFAPEVTISAPERKRLDSGETIVRVEAGRDGYLSLTAVVRVNVDGDRLAAWASSVEKLQRGRYVTEIGRFSTPPRAADLSGLTIEPDDLDAMAECRAGDCGVKLSAAEMQRLRGLRNRATREAVFRDVLLQRAAAYQQQGDLTTAPYHDDDKPVQPREMFATLLARVEFFARNAPRHAAYLREYPRPAPEPVAQSFLYWSKERLGMKPIVSITHFSVARHTDPAMPETVIAAKQVYASHYKNAALTLTSLVAQNAARYLVYVNRSHVDAFHGFFGPVVRRVVERRVRGEAPNVLAALRRRLESGEPSAVP
jgi:hypothetical protein